MIQGAAPEAPAPVRSPLSPLEPTARTAEGHPRHLDALTGLRGLAALWVLAYHVWVFAGTPRISVDLGRFELLVFPLLSTGWAGVIVLFALSAFLLGRPFAAAHRDGREPPAWLAYAARRFARVFPAYWFQWLVLLALGVLIHQQWPAWTVWVRQLVMAYGPPPLLPALLNGVWWTLPIELGFYLLLPFLAFALTPRRVLPLWLGCVAVMVAWRMFALDRYGAEPELRLLAVYALPGSLDMFACGLVAAVVVVHASPHLAGILRSTGLAAVTLAAIAVVLWTLAVHGADYWSGNWLFFSWSAVFAACIALLIAQIACGQPQLVRTIGATPVRWLGTVSYSVYLWHLPIVLWLVRKVPALADGPLGGATRFLLLLAATLALTLPLSALSYRWIEAPAIAWARRRFPRGG